MIKFAAKTAHIEFTARHNLILPYMTRRGFAKNVPKPHKTYSGELLIITKPTLSAITNIMAAICSYTRIRKRGKKLSRKIRQCHSEL